MSGASSSGGAGGGGGFTFQDAVASWAAVGVLAEQAISPRWELTATVSYTEIRCEADLPVDDLVVVTSVGGGVYFQSKRGLTRSENESSSLASALNQFVRMFHAQRPKLGGPRAWDRPLDPSKDRLVLVTNAPAPHWVCEDAPALLHRFRRDSSLTSLLDAAVNDREKQVAQVLTNHVMRHWCAVAATPSSSELRAFFALVWIDHLDLKIDGSHSRDDLAAMDHLRLRVLDDPAQAETAYSLLR